MITEDKPDWPADSSDKVLKNKNKINDSKEVSQNVKNQTERLFPQPNENVLKNTKLIQVQTTLDLVEETFDENVNKDTDPYTDPWHDIKLEKVVLNKYINLSYISEENFELVVRRLYKIENDRQKRFKKIIKEMRYNKDESKSSEYIARIMDNGDGYNFNILFLNFSRYLKSLLHPPTRRVLQTANMVYPQGILMQWFFRILSAKTLNTNHSEKPVYEFLTEFNFTVNLLSDLDKYHCSIFLIGGTALELNHLENSLKTSFQNIKILGRYTARYQRYQRGRRINEIRTVINKSAPTLLLLTKNINIHDFIDGKNGERKIKSFFVLDYPKALQDFSSKYRPSKIVFLKVLAPLTYLLFPWKWPELFCILIFLIKILFLSIFTVKKN